MCWFITVGVPIASRHLLAQIEGEFRGLAFQFIESTPTAAVFGPGFACAQVTFGGCSCSLMLRPTDVESELEKHRARLHKKGLSNAKIRQSLEAKAHVLASPKRVSEERVAFVAAISRLVELGAEAQLFAHVYRGDQHAEAVPRPGTRVISIRALETAGLPADTLIRFRAEV